MLGAGLLVAAILAQEAPVPPPSPADEAPASSDPAPPGDQPAPPPESLDVDLALRRAKNEYAYGNYDRAAEQLKALMYPMRLRNDEQVLEARKYLALSYYLTGKVALASEEFGKLLYISPDHELDPYAIAPPIIELFELVRDKMKPELDAIRQRKSDEQLAAPTQAGYRRTIEVTISERSDFATLMPFGVGQFQNNDYGWGIFFAVTEAALLAANVAAYAWAASIGDYHGGEEDKRVLLNRLTVAQYAALAGFGIAWSVGVYHARLHFTPILRAPPVVRDEPMRKASLGGVLSLGFEL